MDNNKNQRLVNYFSAILLILVIVIVSYTIYTQRTTLQQSVPNQEQITPSFPLSPLDQTNIPTATPSQIEEILRTFEEPSSNQVNIQDNNLPTLYPPLPPSI